MYIYIYIYPPRWKLDLLCAIFRDRFGGQLGWGCEYWPFEHSWVFGLKLGSLLFYNPFLSRNSYYPPPPPPPAHRAASVIEVFEVPAKGWNVYRPI